MAEKEGRKELFRALADPPEEFTPVPFWFLNDRPDQEKIAEQLKDIKAKGVDAIVPVSYTHLDVYKRQL